MPRSEITIDLGAVRRNARVLLGALAGGELWAVVKADGYGHGAIDVGGAALGAGATALCTTTVAEAVALRTVLRNARIIVLGPVVEQEFEAAREARLELVVADDRPLPEAIPVHLKLDTGMGRWGLSELPTPSRHVVGLMSHLATAELQIDRFRQATDAYSSLTRHIANSAATLRLPSARFDAGRCGIALYGLSPFGVDPVDDGLEPVLGWRSEVARVKLLEVGESTGYGRRFLAGRPTWIGIVPVGYADGFRRDLTGTSVRVGDDLRTVVGAISMDSFAVELPDRVPLGTPVTLIGDGVLADDHARVAGTISYELVCGIGSCPVRARRSLVDDA